MVRLGVSVEGATEERFIKTVVTPYLLQKNIIVMPIGGLNGNINIDRIKHEIRNLIYSFDYVTTLYDFYGFKGKTATDTKASLEEKILNSVKPELRNKLIPYIQMYEFEGLLFSSPKEMASHLQGNTLNEWAVNILNQFDNNPEKINDSPQTAPSKRLIKHTNYQKTTHGPNIAKGIGIDNLRAKCVGFNDWLQRIEQIVS